MYGRICFFKNNSYIRNIERKAVCMNTLVVGCGELGSRLADMLCRHGHNVSVVNDDLESFKLLSDDFDGITVAGVPMDIEVLKKAGAENCDAVAITTDDDNLNITISQIVREFFGVQNVVTRIIDPAREKIFKHLGFQIMCETKLSTEAMFSVLVEKTSVKQITFGASTLSFLIRDAEQVLIGRSMHEIPHRSSELVVGVINKENDVTLNTEKNNAVISSTDKIIYAKIIY
ncbi:MAG: TrkA family potassium uptake protein [Oscillospiraceae bacterium]|nr:TrkA family potassium uptake protein [Oscillospiraceae bacterium]